MLNQALWVIIRKDNIMAEFDPIANISRFSPTKHLQKREADTGSALQRLMSGRLIQSDRDIAAGQRADTQNRGALNRVALQLGLGDPSAEGFGAERQQFGRDKRFVDLLTAAAKGRRAGISPQLPKGGLNITGFPGRKYSLTDFPGAARAKIDLEAARELSGSTEGVGFPGGPDIGLQKRKQGWKDKFKAKNTAQAKALVTEALGGDTKKYDRIVQAVRVKFGEDASEPFTTPNGGIYIQVGNKDVRID